MKRLVHKSITMWSVAAILGSATAVQAQGVRWAGAVDWSSLRLNVLHAPDARVAPLDPPVVVSDFGPVMRHPGLRGLLDISPEDFARADVIAFEGNGGHGAGVEEGWESSIWTFTDGVSTVVVKFNELVGRSSDASIVATGSIYGPDGTILTGNAAYSEFFGLCAADPASSVISYILFDLDAVSPAVDTNSPSFAIRMKNGFVPDHSFGEGTPDPDAVGILTKCSGGC